MPVMDVYEATRQLYLITTCLGVFVVWLTANIMRGDDRENCISMNGLLL